jgi:hypothetical protein
MIGCISCHKLFLNEAQIAKHKPKCGKGGKQVCELQQVVIHISDIMGMDKPESPKEEKQVRELQRVWIHMSDIIDVQIVTRGNILRYINDDKLGSTCIILIIHETNTAENNK